MQSLTAYLCAAGAAEAIAFYEDAFGAELVGDVWRDPADGRIGHSELRIGDSVFFLSDEYPELGVLSPTTRGGATSAIVAVVEDVDVVWARAIAAGAIAERDITEGNGMRSGWLRDPWGHRWNVGTPLEE